jgi:hypothetical protein
MRVLLTVLGWHRHLLLLVHVVLLVGFPLLLLRLRRDDG